MPPAWVRPNWNVPSAAGHCWLTFLLPYVDEAGIYWDVDFDQPPVADMRPYSTPVTAYRCPSDTMEITNALRGGFPTANYSGNIGRMPLPRWLPAQMSDFWPGALDTPREVNGVMCCNSRIRFRDVNDGTSNTFIVGERCVTSGAGIWPGVTGSQNENDVVSDCSHGSLLNTGYSSYSSLHPGGANFLMCDGSVHFIADTIDSAPASEGRIGTYQRLADRADGERVEF
jgi:prepilin-type processing-associated H-X9-DG protein